MSLAEYHALDAIGNGRISDFIAGSDIYFARYLCAKDDPRYMPPDEGRRPSRIGSMIHASVLEGHEEMLKRYRPWRGGLTKGRVLKSGEVKDQAKTMSKTSEAYSAFVEECRADGVTACDANDLDVCEIVATALYGNEDARYLLGLGASDDGQPTSEGTNEVTLLFEQLGMPCKARPDRVIPSSDALPDLKTTGLMDLDAIRKFAISHGYHRQAAWYRRAYFANYGRACKLSPFITVRTEKPYRVWVWTFDVEAEAVADVELDMALADILGRLQTNDWTPEECRAPQWDCVGIRPYEIRKAVAEEIKERQYRSTAAA